MAITYAELRKLAESRLRRVQGHASAHCYRATRLICGWWRATYPIGKAAPISSESPRG
jgi:hypothetical protein